MLQILYVSGASGKMSDADIANILTASRHNNLRDGITGMLLWADGVFIQILEGEPDVVRALYGRIQEDNRHRNLMLVHEQVTEKRLFAQWSMGFKQLDPAAVDDRKIFQISRAALADRIASGDGGLLLETVLAFSGDLITDLELPLKAARA